MTPSAGHFLTAATLRPKRPRLRQWLYDRRGVRPSAWLLLILILLAPVWSTDDRPVDHTFAGRVETLVGARAFSIAGWELTTLAGRAAELLPGRQPAVTAADSHLVRDYFATVERVNQLGLRETEILATQPEGWEKDLAAVRSELAEARADRTRQAPIARAVLEEQFAAELAELGLRRALIEVRPTGDWPPLQVRITPALFFTFTELPLVLSIGPRDRIAITHSTLLDAGLDTETKERLEDRIDRSLDVASIITPIGGFAAYPSMVPSTAGLSGSLETIAHEWIHHYLVFRPLGWNYFSSYEMRTVNETVADIAGREIAERVRRKYYPPGSPPAPPAARPAPRVPAEREDFGTAMRRIRRETEALLARGDLEAVDRYLADQRRRLAAEGYYLRKLNTTYLAFFGSYSGGGNSFEPPLRRLRERSPSLAAFLETIAQAGTPEEAQRILESP